jgi:hypothetical protein
LQHRHLSISRPLPQSLHPLEKYQICSNNILDIPHLLGIHLLSLGPIAGYYLFFVEGANYLTDGACFDFFLFSFRNCLGLGIVRYDK